MARQNVKDRANYIGVVFDRAQNGAVLRIINPDFDWQLDLAETELASNEYLLKIPKEVFGVSKEKDAMTLAQVDWVCKTLGPRQ